MCCVLWKRGQHVHQHLRHHSTLARFDVIHAFQKGETIKSAPVARLKSDYIKSTIRYCAHQCHHLNLYHHHHHSTLHLLMAD